MKNFTNNFKQFTSRLGARWLIMALMMLVGTSSAWAANKYTNNYIFLDLSGFTSWADGGAVMKVGMCNWDNLGNGHQMSTFEMTKVPGENYIYYADISSSLSTDRYGVKFSRHSSDGTEWDSFFSAYNSGNCGKPNNWKSGEIVNLQDVYCISAPTFGEVEVGQSATSSGEYLYAGVTTIPTISNNDAEFQYVAGSSSITTNGLSTITVKFTPSSAGDKTGTLKFGSYLTTSLSGKGKVSTKIPSGTKLYFDFSNATTWGSGHFLSIVAPDNTSYTAGYGNTSGVGNGNYSPKKDQTWVSLTEECTNIYSYTTTTDITTGISLWANNINTYNDVYQTDVVLNLKASDFDSQKLCFTVGSNSTNHGTQKTDCFGGSWGSTIPVCCTSPDFSVQLSNATVTKGDANIKASVTGIPSSAVTWSSSEEEVATIDADGKITAIKGGETTITATTNGDGGFCEDVAKPATLTVKENPTVRITADHNPICSGEEATLTANISNLSVGINPTVSWYKKGENGVKHTGTTYNPTTSGEYYVVVTGDYVNEVSLEKEPLQFIINQTPTLESTLENKATEVEICGSGNATLSVTSGFDSYSWGDGNTKTVNATGKYKVTATDGNGCTSNEVEFDVKVLNPTVTLVGDQEQIVCPGANANFEVDLTEDQSVSWKNADETEISTSNPFTPQIEGEAGTTYTYKVVVSEGSCSSEEETVTAMVRSDAPQIYAPMISISQGTICEDGSATITVNNPIPELTYTLYKETEQIGDPVNYQTDALTFNVTEAGSYTVRAEESVCNNYANSMPVELKVVTNDVKIGLAVDKTTVNPWQPLKLTVTPPEGYAYTIDGLADVVYTQSGDVYTIKIPRPGDWSKGNSSDPVKTKPITFSAKIQVTDDLTCGTSSVNVTLADTEENCE